MKINLKDNKISVLREGTPQDILNVTYNRDGSKMFYRKDNDRGSSIFFYWYIYDVYRRIFETIKP